MRILYVIPSLLVGGAEALVCQWAAHLQQSGHEVEVCTLYTDGPFASQLEGHQIPIHNFAHDPGIAQYRLRRKYDLRLVQGLDRLVQQGHYHIVHAHLFPALFHVALLTLISNTQPSIYSVHSVNNRRRRYRATRHVDRALFSRFARIVAASETVRQRLCDWLPALSAKVQVVANSVDASRFQVAPGEVEMLRQKLGIPTEQAVILYAGRLIPEKGADVLLEALSGMAPTAKVGPRVLVAGDGPMMPSLRERAAGLVGAEVTFLSNRRDIPQLLNLADLVVLPSRWEGLPMILLESMAAGTPVLASRVGGIPDVVESGVNGWLVPPEDPVALRGAIDMLLANDTLRWCLSEKGFETVTTRFSPGATLGQLLNIYEEARLCCT